MATPSLSIIIVDYNSSKLIKECLTSLSTHLPSSLNYEVIIVDSASPENHLDEYRETSSKVKTFRLEKNKGYGAANNFGAKQAEGEYLLLLNPDTLALDNSIEKMLAFHKKHEEIGALTCLLYGRDKKTLQEHFFGKFQSLGTLTIRRYNHQKVDFTKDFFYTNIVTGAALMIKKGLFEKVGKFDENIFMYLEDDDLCKRLVELGYKNAVLNTAKIIHLEGATTNKAEKKKYYFASQNYYWKKHNGPAATLLMRLIRFPFKFLVFLRSK